MSVVRLYKFRIEHTNSLHLPCFIMLPPFLCINYTNTQNISLFFNMTSSNIMFAIFVHFKVDTVISFFFCNITIFSFDFKSFKIL